MTHAPFTVRHPTDLIALAPHLLGFRPRDSVLLMTFGEPGRAFHARVDLPNRAGDQDAVAELLLSAVVRNDAHTVAVLVFSTDEQATRAQAEVLAGRLVDAGVRVLDVLRVEDDCYFDALDGSEPGTPYDVSAHPFTARMVFEGNVVQPSREALADTLVGTDAERVAAVADAAEPLEAADRPPTSGEAEWFLGQVRRGTGRAEPLPVPVLSRLLVDCRSVVLRDLAWAACSRSNAGAHVSFWTRVVRDAPHELVASPAALLAFAAWLSGDGALAWCAVDRCLEADPDHPLARMVAEMLENAVPPHSWDPLDKTG